jgi:two-component system, chemotaxis family, chemotaxis protein CheY
MEPQVARSDPEGRDARGALRPTRRRAPTRILIVDDDPAMRLLCAVNLELEGLVVLEAADGRHGLARARAERPDLILTDVSMPVLDGFELAEALRRDRRTRRIPLVFLSGESTAANRARAEKLGALGYVTKPFDPLRLGGVVVDALALARERRRTRLWTRRRPGSPGSTAA